MNTIFPKRLKKGSHIRVIAPSRSAYILSNELIEQASEALKEEGFTVSFSKNIKEHDEFLSSSIDARITDLHDAFTDTSVDGILTAIGGYNANQLLPYIDYDLIRKNPKVLCGFSDITVLSNAIFAKTGLVTYSGPHFSTWGMLKGFDYTKESFLKCVSSNKPIELKPCNEWSDDLWFIEQDKRFFIENDGYIVVNSGSAEGRIIGGHARCLAALQGTDFWPGLQNSILMIEEDEEIDARLFDRLLESFTQQHDFSGVKGIIIGRFQKASDVTSEKVTEIIRRKQQLNNIPILVNFDIGHTSPIVTFPVGGTLSMEISKSQSSIKVLKH